MVFGYLKPGGCERGEHCGCAKLKRGETFRFTSPLVDSNRRYPTVEFSTQEQFWEWFLPKFPHPLSFDDFLLVGCWDWVREWEEFPYFSELYTRHRAADRLHVASFGVFDDAPARLLEHLLLLDNELQAAQVDYGKRKNKRV